MSRLTAREVQVLRALASTGVRNEDLAVMLDIRAHTVKAHLGNISRKLGLNSRLQLVVYAWSEGIVEPKDISVGYRTQLEVGDQVVFHDGKRLLRGKVAQLAEVIEVRVTILGEDGTTYEVSPSAAHRVPQEG